MEPLNSLAEQLRHLKEFGPEVLEAYLRNVRLDLYTRAKNVIMEVEK